MKKIEILNAFIENELEAIDKNESSSDWYVMNWGKLKKDVIAAAPKLLDEELLLAFYALLIRKGLLYDEPIREHYPAWEEAYRRHAPGMVRKPYQNSSSMTRLSGLCLFGFDHAIAVDKNNGYEDYYLYRQALSVPGNNMPDILKRAERLLPFADDEKVIQRFSKALEGLDFIFDDWYGITNTEEHYDYTNLAFFKILLMLHLSGTELARKTIEKYQARLPFLPKAEEQEALMARCEKACQEYRG